MAKINKTLDMGGGITVKVAIDDGKAVMVSNYGREMFKIYMNTKKAGKNVTYDYRSNAMIETFPETAEEYEKKLDKDILTSKRQQKIVIKKTKKEIQEKR
jgi:hypothetical protein